MEIKEFEKKYYNYLMERLSSLNAFYPTSDVILKKSFEDMISDISGYLKKEEKPILGIFVYVVDENKEVPLYTYMKLLEVYGIFYSDISDLCLTMEEMFELFYSNQSYKTYIDSKIDLNKMAGVLE